MLIQSIKENNETVTTFEYNEQDNIKKIVHKVTSSKTLNKDYSYWEYDGSLWKIDYSGFLDYSIVFALYDFDNCKAAKMIKFANTDTAYTYKYEDNISNKLIEVAYYTIKHSITYDLFNNVSSIKTTNEDNNVSITYDFAYKTNSNKITSFVKDVTVRSIKNNTLLKKEDFSYSYNALGNITTMIHNDYENHYSYDSFNRLSIEDNQRMYKSFSYEYDNNGNLTMVKEGSYDFKNYKVKQRFAYNNFNQLTKVVYSDGSYDEITSYDSYGNPHLIKKMKYCLSGSCCTSENIVLSYGRNNMLERYGDNYYYYNEEGIRIAKEENGLIHKYYVEDNIIHKEEIRNKSSNQLVKEIYYYYDETGISAFRINSNIYYYLKDLTGLILGIYNSDGVIVARYVYDAFGNHKVCDGYYNANTNDSFIGNINPFRYKSYYYDKESNLYYLNSRYYSPIYYRFISPDDISYLDPSSINGLNLYAYCENDPIMYVDPSGHFAISTFLIGLAVTSLVSWGISEIFGAQIVSGVGSIANGMSAISTGISLFAFGPVGWIIGGIGIVAGLASIAFGTAEIQEGLGYGNWINDIGITGDLYTGLYIGSNIVSSLTTIGGNIYRNSRITSGVSQADKTGRAYSRYYQMEGNEVKSITHYGKGGTPKYRIDILGRPHNGLLPHKHNFVINNGFANKGSVDDIHYLLWLLLGNWR